jgi:spermidine synthase
VPECAIDIVEIRRQVIDLSREFFLLPAENANLRIFHAGGGDFIGSRGGNPGNYDMIIVDAFDEKGPAASLLEKDFLSSCRIQLKKNGVFIINLWNSPGYNFSGLYSSIRDAFGNNASKLLLAESYRNAVVFGFENPAILRNLPGYRRIAAELQRKHGINFPRYLRNLCWQNFNEQGQ